MSEHSPGNIGCKFIAAFVSLTSHLIMHQIDVTSAHFSVAFNIPLNNISIYFSKLFSFRCLLIAVGTVTEFLISEIFKIFDPGGTNGDGVKRDSKYRKYISMGCFGVVLVMRVLLLLFLHFASNLGYYVYIVLSIEAFFFGYFHASVLAIVPQHSLAVALAANVSRVFILLIQFVLDLMFYSRPLVMIRLQVWLGAFLTLAAFISWIYYHFGSCESIENTKEPSEQQQNKKVKFKNFGKTFIEAFSPFLMFFVASMFKDFLYPGVLPYALLLRDKCHIINMMVPIANMVGPLILFFLEIAQVFPKWESYFDWFWILAVPMAIVFIFSMLAIHTRIPAAKAIVNSRNAVMMITLGVVFGNGFLDPLSFGGVAKVVKPEQPKAITNSSSNGSDSGTFNTESSGGSSSSDNSSEAEEGDNRLITFHAILALFMRFVFSKLSVGYNDTRVSLGYCLPKFRPTHKMSKSNLGWYIFWQTFKRAWKDTGSDFSMNIKNYL